VSDGDQRGTSERPSERSKAVTDQPVTDEPALRIITADASDEEVAALVAVFAVFTRPGSVADEAPAPTRPEWNAPHRLVRATHPHGPGGWRASGLPR